MASSPELTPHVELRGVSKRFADLTVVDDVELTIGRGELFALLGPSGCGKTTLLRMLAGLERPSAGRILLAGEDIADVPPYRRPVNMMFQSYALFPHMTVEQNVAFGLKQEGVARPERQRRVEAMLALVQMGSYARRRPHQLSGGQRQRVALARALVKEPKLLLLDEPLAALDKKLRRETQFELMSVQQRVGITFVMVTHDQEEAMTMAHRMAVMDRGRVQQVGTPAEIYEQPQSRFVAEFIGEVNLFEGEFLGVRDGRAQVRIAGLQAPLELERPSGSASADDVLPAGAAVAVAVRPEKIRLEPCTGAFATNRASGRVKVVGYLGDISAFHVEMPDGRVVRVTRPNEGRGASAAFSQGTEVDLVWDADAPVMLSR